MTITQFELGWLVGILEGEGHFRYTNRTQRVTVNMTDEDTIYKLVGIFTKITGNSCDPVCTDKSKYNVNAKPIYSAVLYGANARAVMALIVRHLGFRRRQRVWQCLNGHEAISRVHKKAAIYSVVNLDMPIVLERRL